MTERNHQKTIYLTAEDIEHSKEIEQVDASKERVDDQTQLREPSDATLSMSRTEMLAIAAEVQREESQADRVDENTTTASFRADMINAIADNHGSKNFKNKVENKQTVEIKAPSMTDLSTAHISEVPTAPLTQEMLAMARGRALESKKIKSTLQQKGLNATTEQWKQYVATHALPAQVVVSLFGFDSLIYRLNLGLFPLLKANYEGTIHVYISPHLMGLERTIAIYQTYKWMNHQKYTSTHEYLMTRQSPWTEEADGLGQLICFERGCAEPIKTQVIGNIGHVSVEDSVIEAHCLGAMLAQRAHQEIQNLVLLSDYETPASVTSACMAHQTNLVRVRI